MLVGPCAPGVFAEANTRKVFVLVNIPFSFLPFVFFSMKYKKMSALLIAVVVLAFVSTAFLVWASVAQAKLSESTKSSTDTATCPTCTTATSTTTTTSTGTDVPAGYIFSVFDMNILTSAADGTAGAKTATWAYWDVRRGAVVDEITELNPDIITLQEVTEPQLQNLTADLGGTYTFFGDLRPADGASTREANPVAYRTAAFTRLEGATVPYASQDPSDFPRIFTWCRLQAADGTTLLTICTQFVSKNAAQSFQESSVAELATFIQANRGTSHVVCFADWNPSVSYKGFDALATTAGMTVTTAKQSGSDGTRPPHGNVDLNKNTVYAWTGDPAELDVGTKFDAGVYDSSSLRVLHSTVSRYLRVDVNAPPTSNSMLATSDHNGVFAIFQTR